MPLLRRPKLPFSIEALSRYIALERRATGAGEEWRFTIGHIGRWEVKLILWRSL